MSSLPFSEFADFSGGMNKAIPADSIADNELSMLQDIIPGKAGVLPARGGVERAMAANGNLAPPAGFFNNTQEPHGVFTSQKPDGAQRIGASMTDAGGTSRLGAFATDFSSFIPLKALSSPYALNADLPVLSASPRLGSGTFIGLSNGYEQYATNRHLAVWHGADFVDYNTGTVDYTRGSPTVTGHSTNWTDNVNVCAGMYLFASSGLYLGTVVTVISTTSLMLDRPCPTTASGVAYLLSSFRGVNFNVGGGRITTFTDSTTVIGADTLFVDAALSTGTWNLYRASDWKFIGTVSSVASDTGLILGSNAAIALVEEEYTALRTDLVNHIDLGSYTPYQAGGFLTTTYADRQWYANMAYSDFGYGTYLDSAWYSEEGRPEVVNSGQNKGSRIQIQNTKQNPNAGVRGFLAGVNGIVTAKDRETHLITGDNPDNFATQKITDDGCIAAGSMVGWNGGVIWAGWDGVWFWDGASPHNLTQQRLGDFYKNLLVGFNENHDRAWGFVHRDYYVLHVERLKKPVSLWNGLRNGSNLPVFDNSPTLNLCIHIPTGAISFLRSVNHYGAVKYTGASVGDQTIMCSAVDGGTHIPAMAIFRANNILDGTAGAPVTWNPVYRDTSSVWQDEASGDPRPYLETKAYDLGQPLRKKAWRALLLHYRSSASDAVGVVPFIDPDLSAVATTTPIADMPATSGPSYAVKRTKFVRRSRKIGFKIMFFDRTAAAALKSIGLSYKLLPTGRV